MKTHTEPCPQCGQSFEPNDMVVDIDDTLYHESCLTIVPTEYTVFANGEYVGTIPEDIATPASAVIDF